MMIASDDDVGKKVEEKRVEWRMGVGGRKATDGGRS